MTSGICQCCDRRTSTDACNRGPWYCRRCKLCASHCRCEKPGEWVDATDELDRDDAEAVTPDAIADGLEIGNQLKLGQG
jgi:hypothetical protein